jgi:hypothetical protein
MKIHRMFQKDVIQMIQENGFRLFRRIFFIIVLAGLLSGCSIFKKKCQTCPDFSQRKGRPVESCRSGNPRYLLSADL